METIKLSPEHEELITQILRRGNSAEIKKERDNLVIVEIERKVRNKTVITG